MNSKYRVVQYTVAWALWYGAAPNILGEWQAGHFRRDWVFGE